MEEYPVMELSLEEVVSYIKVPPSVRQCPKFSEREKFFLHKKNYEDSLKRLLSSDEKNLPFNFRYFIDRHHSYFGEDLSSLLRNLDNPTISCVVGSLIFEKNIHKFRKSIPSDSNLENTQ